MQKNQQWTGEALEEALKAVVETEAGWKLLELGNGPCRDELVEQWHEDLVQKRYEKRRSSIISTCQCGGEHSTIIQDIQTPEEWLPDTTTTLRLLYAQE